jgi:hypothetical protein
MYVALVYYFLCSLLFLNKNSVSLLLLLPLLSLPSSAQLLSSTIMKVVFQPATKSSLHPPNERCQKDTKLAVHCVAEQRTQVTSVSTELPAARLAVNLGIPLKMPR